jgi:hypothetical protein
MTQPEAAREKAATVTEAMDVQRRGLLMVVLQSG